MSQLSGLLSHNVKVMGSNVGPETGYSNRLFVVFLSPYRKMMGQGLILGHNHFLPYSLRFIIH
jgi:hypothetical protein